MDNMLLNLVTMGVPVQIGPTTAEQMRHEEAERCRRAEFHERMAAAASRRPDPPAASTWIPGQQVLPGMDFVSAASGWCAPSGTEMEL